MKTKHKELLLEMIYLSENKEITTNYLDTALDKMGGFSEAISSIDNILRWLHPLLSKIHEYDLNKLSVYAEGLDNNYIIGKMQELFKYCPELKELFVLEEKHITFNKKLSKSDIDDLRKFVDDNTERKVGSVYIRKTK